MGYTAFGTAYSPRTSVSVEQRYTYTGRETTQDPTLMYYRYRIYGMRIGRFMQRDPASIPYALLDSIGRKNDQKIMGRIVLGRKSISFVSSEKVIADDEYLLLDWTKDNEFSPVSNMTSSSWSFVNIAEKYGAMQGNPCVYQDPFGLWPYSVVEGCKTKTVCCTCGKGKVDQKCDPAGSGCVVVKSGFFSNQRIPGKCLDKTFGMRFLPHLSCPIWKCACVFTELVECKKEVGKGWYAVVRDVGVPAPQGDFWRGAEYSQRPPYFRTKADCENNRRPIK